MSPGERIDFPSLAGDRLAARLDRPDGTPRAFALFAHCFTCTKDFPATSRIARGLAQRGIAVLRFDFTGLGHSEGEFANASFQAVKHPKSLVSLDSADHLLRNPADAADAADVLSVWASRYLPKQEAGPGETGESSR